MDRGEYPSGRGGISDTTPEAHRRLIEILRAMTPEERLLKTLQRMEDARTLRRLTSHLRPGPGEE